MDKDKKQDTANIITEDMLDFKLDGISLTAKMKTKADSKHDYTPADCMLTLDYTDATLRDVSGWSYGDRRIAQQNVMRALGQDYIEDNPELTIKAVDIKAVRVAVDTTPAGLIRAGAKAGKTMEETIAEFLAYTSKLESDGKVKDEAALLDGVDIPSKQ